jgi:hypothetical protein
VRTPTYPSVDLSAIVESVLKEQGGSSRLLSVSLDPQRRDMWLIRIEQLKPPLEIQVTVSCGPGSSPVDVRRSVKRQLGLE